MTLGLDVEEGTYLYQRDGRFWLGIYSSPGIARSDVVWRFVAAEIGGDVRLLKIKNRYGPIDDRRHAGLLSKCRACNGMGTYAAQHDIPHPVGGPCTVCAGLKVTP